MTPEVNSGSSQELTLPTKTRAGSILVSGRQMGIPPSPTGPPPRQLPAIPTAATAVTHPPDYIGPSRLPRLRAPSSRTRMSHYPPQRRPVSDGYPLGSSLTSVNRNGTLPLRGLPLPPINRPNVEEGVPARPATWATQDAFAQIDALLQDGLQTPVVGERGSTSSSSVRFRTRVGWRG